jgi:hypothetical protein
MQISTAVAILKGALALALEKLWASSMKRWIRGREVFL